MSSLSGYISSARVKLRSYVPKPESQGLSTLPRCDFFESQPENQVQEGTSWRAWIKEKGRERLGWRNRGGAGSTDIEVINLFPGWAARRYAPEGDAQLPPQFEVEIFVSGFACSRRDPENATRSQRAFLRLAKSFAGLPKIIENAASVAPYESTLAHLTPKTEERLAFIPQNDTESDTLDIETLDRELNLAKQDDGEDTDISETSSSYGDSPSQIEADRDVPVPHLHVLRRLHDNLEHRIRCLWYTALPNRTVRLHFLISPHKDAAVPEKYEASSGVGDFSLDPEDGFLVVQEVTTGADGSFQAKVRVKWEDLCHHPRALHLAFGETIEDHDLLVIAKLLPNQPSPSHSPTVTSPSTPTAPLAAITRIPITHSPIRVISDIDDTVKHSGILLGARVVFHNVFVKDLRDSVIPGMGEWYTKMFSQGVRFHYVSNGPFAILPILNDFFHISQLPLGSLKLKSYAGRSIFDGLLSAPATRKRTGILEILDSFPDSLFFLIGDTGEQDLELYADIARERPDQILGVFVRDARPDNPTTPEPLSDPTGSKAMPLNARNDDERPPISRTQTSTSLVSLLKRFPSYRTKDSVWRTASLPSLGVANAVALPSNNTPSNPGRSTVDGVPLTPGSAKEKSRESYFGFGPLTSQPEEEDNQTGLNSSLPSSPISLQSSNQLASPSERSTEDQVFITEPPKPISGPSVTITHSPRSPSASFSSKRARSTSSMSSVFETGDGQNASNASPRDQLQRRVYRARKLIPERIVLRVFGDPSECVEVDEILGHEGMGHQQ